ncbi:MAG: UDP-N-acetylmuramate dehydrogenase [Clostridiales bacterium]|nr:UDP-N-acetylmuramate dehydrogenase [Candidatus Equinaster intestinalis]
MDIKSFLNEYSIAFKENEPLKNHTSFKIGGNAEIFVMPKSFRQLENVYDFCKENGIKITLLGNGSNVLINDEGIKGVVITLSKIKRITVNKNSISCCSGALLSSVCKTALERGLSGLEFAFGIPGSVGGAVFMNAGAYGGEIKDIIVSAKIFDGEKIKTISAKNMKLGYRTSIFKENGSVILSVKFALNEAPKSEIKANMDDFISRRKAKQPLDFPSAGSTFKRPEGNFAGALIEKSGLKGFSIGGAKVSEKHAGFVINCKNATAKDVKAVIEAVRQKVFEDSGIMLEREVIYL